MLKQREPKRAGQRGGINDYHYCRNGDKPGWPIEERPQQDEQANGESELCDEAIKASHGSIVRPIGKR